MPKRCICMARLCTTFSQTDDSRDICASHWSRQRSNARRASLDLVCDSTGSNVFSHFKTCVISACVITRVMAAGQAVTGRSPGGRQAGGCPGKRRSGGRCRPGSGGRVAADVGWQWPPGSQSSGRRRKPSGRPPSPTAVGTDPARPSGRPLRYVQARGHDAQRTARAIHQDT